MAEGKKKCLSLSLKRKIVVSDEEEIEKAKKNIENMKEKSIKHSVKSIEESSEESSSTYQCEQSKEIGAEEKENVFSNDVLKGMAFKNL